MTQPSTLEVFITTYYYLIIIIINIGMYVYILSTYDTHMGTSDNVKLTILVRFMSD